MARKPRRGKYNAKRTTICGIAFSSQKEANRYLVLADMERRGEITELELQPPYPMVVNGVQVCVYNADFRYRKNGELVVEDVKSPATMTPVYRLKKRLLKVLWGIDVLEVL